MRFADSLARANAGRSMLARIAIIAITTRSSIKVNADFLVGAPFRGALFRFKKNRLFHLGFMRFITFIIFGTNNSVTFASTLYLYDEKAMDPNRACRRARRPLALPQ